MPVTTDHDRPLAAPMRPGRYLELRRTAAGLDLADVARMLSPAPHGLERVRAQVAKVEADDPDAPSFDLVDELRRCFSFDADVYHLLVAHRADPACELPLPRICALCGCTLYDACHDERRGACAWVSEDLCSHCVGHGALGAAVLADRDAGGGDAA